jgi:hypothetical protein
MDAGAVLRVRPGLREVRDTLKRLLEVPQITTLTHILIQQHPRIEAELFRPCRILIPQRPEQPLYLGLALPG